MNRKEIMQLLTATKLEDLLGMADKVRSACVGEVIHIRALLEFSNHCCRNCSYCGLAVTNDNIKRYCMSITDIITVAKNAYNAGYKTIVMQSGESSQIPISQLAKAVAEITSWGMVVSLSCGELVDDEYELLRTAGAKRYLLKHECADAKMYESMHDGYTLKNRLKCANSIKRLGYEYGGGFLVGLPSESMDLIVDNLLMIQSLGCDMIGVGTFIPHPDTLFCSASGGDYELTLRCVAIVRLMLPYANIPATTSLSIVGDSEKVFSAGANVVMVKVTPQDERESYQIYPTAAHKTDIAKDRENIILKIKRLGREAL